MADQPSYYSILTAEVRYDERLKPNEKLLYSEITALSNKDGYCHASNSYFAKLYKVSTVSVSQWVNHLKKLGYVYINVKRKGQRITQRKIYPLGTPIKEKLNTPIKEKLKRGNKEKLNTPIKEKFKENTTSMNTTSMNTNICTPTDKPTSFNSQCREVIQYLNDKTGKHFKLNASGNRKAIIPRLKDGYTVDDLKKVIDNKVIDWQGVTFNNGQPGDNYLTPTTLFRSSKIDGYLNETPHKDTRQANQQKWQKESQEFSSDYAF